MQSEKERILAEFKKAYESTKQTPRALYGIGANTIFLLENFKDYNIVCLLDSKSAGSTLNGYNICSIDDIDNDVEEIIIVAAYSSLPIIYERIKHIENKGISIKTIFGKLVSKCLNKKQIQKKFYYPNEEDLIKKIDKYDTIYFSVFDVLLNLRLINKYEIFELIELELIKINVKINFKENRILSEKLAYKKYNVKTKISNIYEELKLMLSIDDNVIKSVLDLELKVITENILIRKSGLKYLNMAKCKGKTIILYCDTYLEYDFIKNILLKFGIIDFNKLIVQYQKIKLNEKNTLFISNEKIDKVNNFYYMNYNDLLINSNFHEILNNIENLSDKWLVGDIFTSIFDSPFALNKYQGRIYINDAYVLAKLCISPLVLKFTLFSIEIYNSIKNPKILYTARDGYLFHMIYEELRKFEEFKELPKSEYLLASGRSIRVPNMLTEEDIKERFENIFETDDLKMIENMIYIRFNINLNLSNYNKISNIELLDEIISKKEEIIENSKKERQEYLKYLEQFQLCDYDNIILFDLVTRGTVFYNFSKIIERKIIGCCFGTPRILSKYNEYVNFKSMLGIDYAYDECNYFFLRNYAFLENLFSEDRGRFIKIENSKPLFMKEKPKGENFKETHNQTLKNVLKIIKYNDINFLNNISVSLVDAFAKLILDEYTYKEDEIKKIMTKTDLLEDAYLTYEE